MSQLFQPPLFEGLHWQSGQGGLFDSAAPQRRKIDHEQYSEGYRAGLAGRKLSTQAQVDFATGHEHGAADKRYNQRCADAAKVFKGWTTLPGQTELNL